MATPASRRERSGIEAAPGAPPSARREISRSAASCSRESPSPPDVKLSVSLPFLNIISLSRSSRSCNSFVRPGNRSAKSVSSRICVLPCHSSSRQAGRVSAAPASLFAKRCPEGITEARIRFFFSATRSRMRASLDRSPAVSMSDRIRTASSALR